MAQIHVNPDELERFTKELERFINEAEQLNTGLQGAFSQVSESWRDTENQRFAQELVAASRHLSRFIVTARQHVPTLKKQVEAGRAYLGQRY